MRLLLYNQKNIIEFMHLNTNQLIFVY